MRYLLAVLLLCSFGTLWAQDDTDQALQKAKANLDKAQADYDAALQAKQNAAPTPSATPRAHRLTGIDTNLAIYGDGTVGLDYSYNGQPLESYQDFADIINSANDPKCRNLLAASSTEDTLGWVGYAAGFGLMTYSIVDLVAKADNDSMAGSGWNAISPDLALIGVSNLFIVGGTISFVASHGDFTHAINRYNKLVQRQGQTTSFYFVPNPNQPEVGLVQLF